MINQRLFKHYDSYLETKCEVVSIAGTYVYPIYEVGYQSLMNDADMVFTNEQITACPTITVLLRDPVERFNSCVCAYAKQHKKDLGNVYEKIKKGKIVDRMFMPQYMWLQHLSKHYQGMVHLRTFDVIDEITSLYREDNSPQAQIQPIKEYINIDKKLLKEVNQTVKLEEIVRKYLGRFLF
tara:strand:- start:622 stop:1164 length:543 start_codon:yes stop_codon:yes gene_type:complete